MARNRDIVATRKLNDSNKAKLGRGGDTKIRTVDGRKSHVNAFEAYMIDVKGKAGEEYTKKVGSGEINPYTGMPEYHGGKPTLTDWLGHPAHHGSSWDAGDIIGAGVDLALLPVTGGIRAYEHITGKETGFSTPGELIADPSKKMYDFEQMGEWTGITEPEEEVKFGEKLNFQELRELQEGDPDKYEEYLETWGLEGEDTEFLSGIDDKPFEFIEQEKTQAMAGSELEQQALGLKYEGLGTQQEGIRLGERKLASSRDRSLGALDLGERRLASSRDLQLGALGSQQTALGTSARRGLQQAGGARDVAASRSGLATSGSVTQGFEAQKQALMQDYAAGTKDVSRQKTGVRADYGFGMEQSRAERAGVQADYGFGMEQSGLDRTALGIETKGLALEAQGIQQDRAGILTAFNKAIYGEEQGQLEDFYGEIMSVKQF